MRPRSGGKLAGALCAGWLLRGVGESGGAHPGHNQSSGSFRGRNAMSREAPRQVWLPGSGVWAALGPAVQPGGKDARSEAPNSSSGRRRGPQQGEPARGGRKRSREPSPSHLNASGSRQDSQEHERDAPAAPAAGSPPAAAAAARHTVALTGYALQQDKEDSDVEEVEASPTCPIVSCRPLLHRHLRHGVWLLLSNAIRRRQADGCTRPAARRCLVMCRCAPCSAWWTSSICQTRRWSRPAW